MLELDLGWLLKVIECGLRLVECKEGEKEWLYAQDVRMAIGRKGLIGNPVKDLKLEDGEKAIRSYLGYGIADEEPEGERVDLRELRNVLGVRLLRLVDEFEGLCGVVLDADARRYYESVVFEQSVVRTFPGALHDMEEAGKCFALERYSACGFHLMRVLEWGIFYAGGKLVKQHSGKEKPEEFGKMMWGDMIKDMKNELKSVVDSGTKEALGRIVKILAALNKPWRIDTMHVTEAGEWTMGEAETAFVATRHVMKYIAEKL